MKVIRLQYFFLIIIVILAGLTSRKYTNYLPNIVNLGLGDALWALMIYCLLVCLFPKNSIKFTFLACITICFAVEYSQLLHYHWIVSIRNNKFGALILGQGFLWTDFIAYTLGALGGIIVEKKLRNKI